MRGVRELLDRMSPALLRPVVVPDPTRRVTDVVIAEPGERPSAGTGDLVLGVAVTDGADAAELVRACADLDAAAVLLKPPLAERPVVVAAAERAEIALVEVRSGTAWAQLVWLVRAALAEGSDGDPLSGGRDDLFRLADAVAEVVDAPVTIEDARSQVLAYSARQDMIDPARVSTIMGRGQPADVLAKFRARGTFRQLSKGSATIFVPAQQDGTLPRLVVALRVGGELLGSMWAVVPDEVGEERAAAFAETAPLVALQLLRWRSLADTERQRTAEQVRLLLEGRAGWRTAADELAVRDRPHRVVAIDVASGDAPAEAHRLSTWERLDRGVGQRPLLTEIGTLLYAVVPDDDAGWPALRAALLDDRSPNRPLIAVGGPSPVSDLADSRAEAEELIGLLRGGRVPGPVAVHEQVWHRVVVHRASVAGPEIGALGPLRRLREHDRAQGTDYLSTLHAWLRHPGRPRAAADELRVHPNTFRYRMKRLVEIAPVDLDDPDVRTALLIQLATDRWARDR
ncbi:helix-turn-helix domain-containing protein [Saccharopolyspora cebuensis]|uniref:PucR family transcriptional regulator n=1 Tax=Saccharopolyspora cebuensis TaxID=418759 RepID=A0ABV4CEH8_9PSEU